MSDEETVRKRVEVQDPELSPKANEIITGEVREALETDEVDVPESQAASLGRQDLSSQGSTFSSTLMRSRVLIGMSLAAAVVIAVSLVLITGDWPWLFLVVGVLIAAVLVVSLGAIETTTNVEQPSPQNVDTLEREGVQDPEEVVNAAIRSYTGAQQSATSEALDSDKGSDEEASRPFESPGTGTLQQQSSQTPSSDATGTNAEEDPGEGDGLSPRTLPLIVSGALILACFLIPLLAGGGTLWLVPAIAGPIIIIAALAQLKLLGGNRSES